MCVEHATSGRREARIFPPTSSWLTWHASPSPAFPVQYESYIDEKLGGEVPAPAQTVGNTVPAAAQ